MSHSEVERRQCYFKQLECQLPNGASHLFVQLSKNCLQDIPSKRPTTEELVVSMEEILLSTDKYFGKAVEQTVILWKRYSEAEANIKVKDQEIEQLQQRLTVVEVATN